MAKQDFYELLGVAKGASPDSLKKAYRKIAMDCHPDRHPGDKKAEQRFKDISEAYDVLKDEQKRAAYDRFGHAAFENGGGGRGAGDFASGFANIFDEMFGDFMGGGRQQGAGNRGSDLRYNLEITLEEAFKGKQTTIRVPTLAPCEACKGSGAEAGLRPINCPTCHGAGRVRAQQGFFTLERTCPACHGAGRIIENPCRQCGGQGRTHKEKTLSVTIPPGVEDGTRIRLAGEGEAGMRGAAAGDLYIFLALKPHRLFQRDGAHIHVKVPIAMTNATLGGAIEVPTIDGGRARLTIPAGTQSGHQFRLKGKGMTVLRSANRGDMYVEVAVETPVHLSKRQQELLKEFDSAGDARKTQPEAEGFFAKMKEFFEDLTE
ncbi:MAG TPA: molecular chaperone DnaJ [Stellaceae bacterium]|nr:molecular chaperone DnaJ [Stellaceae bacterium]